MFEKYNKVVICICKCNFKIFICFNWYFFFVYCNMYLFMVLYNRFIVYYIEYVKFEIVFGLVKNFKIIIKYVVR